MRRWLAVGAAALLLTVAVRGGAFPVVPPGRAHVSCTPTVEAIGPVSRAHLRNDVERAEEIAVRHGDAFRKTEGREAEHRRQRDCTQRLLADIAARHAVTLGELSHLRGTRPWLVDALVFATVILGGVVMVRPMAVSMAQRFAEARAWLIAARALASLVCGFAVAATLTLLGHLVEIVRLWDGHMSYRSGRLPWDQHPILLFATGVLLLWTVVVTARVAHD